MCAPASAAAAARCPAPSPLISVACASSVSAPSTLVHAAQLITASGLRVAHGGADRFGVGDVQVGAREGDDVMPRRSGRDDVRAEHARRPR